MDWEIYLDWLADQGFDEMRDVPVYSLVTGIYFPVVRYAHDWNNSAIGTNRFFVAEFYFEIQADDMTHQEERCWGANFVSDAAFWSDQDPAGMGTHRGDGWISFWEVQQEFYNEQHN